MTQSFLISFGFSFIMILPLIIVYGIQEKKNRVRHIIVTFMAPDGTQRQLKTKIGFSWTIFFFKGWALLFRGQFFEWLFMFFSSMILMTLITQSLWNFDVPKLDADGKLPDVDFKNVKVWSWISFAFFTLVNAAISYYFILFGNKRRLKKLVKRGFKFDNGLNGDVSDIWKYIDQPQSGVEEEDLPKNVKKGLNHNFVTPDVAPVSIEEEYNYDGLTPQDMKLLLKSDGIPFHPESSREELLELIEEFVAKPQKKLAREERTKVLKKHYSDKPISELIEELDRKEIKYKDTDTKAVLIKLLIKDQL